MDKCAFQVLQSSGFFEKFSHGKLCSSPMAGQHQIQSEEVCNQSQNMILLEKSLDIEDPFPSNTALEDDEEESVPYLGSLAPFPPSFYYHVANLLICAYSPSPFSSTFDFEETYEEVHENMHPLTAWMDDNSRSVRSISSMNLIHFSFHKHVDAVRVTRILISLMNITFPSLCDADDSSLNIDDNAENSLVHISFLDMFLHYVKGNRSPLASASVVSHHQQRLVDPMITDENTNGVKADMPPPPSRDLGDYPNDPIHRPTGKDFPIIESLFRHYSTLPQLEAFGHVLSRKLRSSMFNASTLPNLSSEERVRTMNLIQAFQSRMEQELKQHTMDLEKIVGTFYEMGDVRLRSQCRIMIGRFLMNFTVASCSQGHSKVSQMTTKRISSVGMPDIRLGSPGVQGIENTHAAGVDSILRILLRILNGIPIVPTTDDSHATYHNMNNSYVDLLIAILIPLHKPSGLLLWRDQTPMLELYHEPLVQCIGALLSRSIYLLPRVIQELLHPDIWPLEGGCGGGSTSAANTPKVVLILHEIDTYFGLLTFAGHDPGEEKRPNNVKADALLLSFSGIMNPLIVRLGSCISSDNSRTSERALQYFKNPQFVHLVHHYYSFVSIPLLRSLLRIDTNMDIPWNPTVRKMTLLVLKELQAYNSVDFKATCEAVLSGSDVTIKTEQSTNYTAVEGIAQDSRNTSNCMRRSTALQRVSKMPPKESNMECNDKLTASGSIPPLTPQLSHPKVLTPNVHGIKSLTTSIRTKGNSQPPVTITGVAPWAMTSLSQRISPSQASLASPLSNSAVENPEGCVNQWWRKISSYMEKLEGRDISSSHKSASSDISDWAHAQMAESPLLLPNLKYQDLVFGHELGSGAFSTVKYARHIVKERSRSTWPEYAVKIISREIIQQLDYNRSINNEIAILQTLFHPSIARLVSSFRFNDSVYLVLEYASGGDLHTILKQSGSLDKLSTRFIIAELVAVLDYIHQKGFIYADLKPENILINEGGHVKLTDFGACRPCTSEAQASLKMKYGLKGLRDGDWRTSTSKSSDISITGDDTCKNDDDDASDCCTRIEGTTAYLSPEVVLGAIPSKAADSWALGCVTFYCLQGRPPMLEEDNDATLRKIVTFDLPKNFDDHLSVICDDTDRDFITQLLRREPAQRLDMIAASQHAFLAGLDVFSLYKQSAHKLNVGKVAPVTDARWSRRQFSSIWAPQPHAYNIGSAGSRTTKTLMWPFKSTAITAGDESKSYFRSVTINLKMSRLDENSAST